MNFEKTNCKMSWWIVLIVFFRFLLCSMSASELWPGQMTIYRDAILQRRMTQKKNALRNITISNCPWKKSFRYIRATLIYHISIHCAKHSIGLSCIQVLSYDVMNYIKFCECDSPCGSGIQNFVHNAPWHFTLFEFLLFWKYWMCHPYFN